MILVFQLENPRLVDIALEALDDRDESVRAQHFLQGLLKPSFDVSLNRGLKLKINRQLRRLQAPRTRERKTQAH